MAKSQIDLLDDEKHHFDALLAAFENLELIQSQAEVYSTSNIHAIRSGSRTVVIEISHKHPAEFCWSVVREFTLQFAAGDLDKYRLTC